MSLRYEIAPQTFAVQVFSLDSAIPVLYQPDYPDGTPWESTEEASAWAELYIASIEDKTAPHAPVGRGLPGEPKLTPEQIAEIEEKHRELDKKI